MNDPDFISLLLNIFPQWPGCGYNAFFSETATLPSLWTTQETRTGMTNRSPINRKMRMGASLREGGWNFRHFAYSLIAPPMYRLLRVSFRRSKPCFVWSPPSPKHTTQICASQPNLYRWTKYAFHSQDHLFIPQDVRLVASKVIDWYQENNPIDRRNEICLKKIYGGNQEANLI